MPDKKPTHDLSDDQRAELQRFARSLQERKRNNTQALDDSDREEMLRFTEELRRRADEPATSAEPVAERPTPSPPVRRDAPTIPVPELPDLSDVVAAARPELSPVGARPTLDRTDQTPRRWTPPERSAVPVVESRSTTPDPARPWKLAVGVLAVALVAVLAYLVFDGGADEPSDPTSTTLPADTDTDTEPVENAPDENAPDESEDESEDGDG